MNTDVKNCSECSNKIASDSGYVTIYKQVGDDFKEEKFMHPKCSDKLDRENFKKTKRLTSHLTLMAAITCARAEDGKAGPDLEVDRVINSAMERLHDDVKRFESEAWFGGVKPTTENHRYLGETLTYARTKGTLQSLIEDSPHRTLSAKLGDITVTGQEMAGRSLIEFEDKVSRITLIAASREQTPRMGVQGIDGTEEQCRRLVNEVRENWRKLKFKKVS
jgi:hypothetical protein